MTYEQLIELGENAGKVSRGLTEFQINKIKSFSWKKSATSADTCTICMDKFTLGVRFKKLLC